MTYGIIRRIVLLALSSAVAVLVVFLYAHNLGLRSPIAALSVVGAALGIVSVNLFTVRWSVPKALLPVRTWEASGRAYALLGVSIYGALLRRPPLRYFNTSVYVGERRANLPSTYANFLRAEGAHFWAFTFTTPLVFYELIHQWWDGFGWLLLFNAIFNVYPVLHLRQVRARLEFLMQRCRLLEKPQQK
jgi:hypothetical protein